MCTEPPLAQSSEDAPHTLNHTTPSPPPFPQASPGGTQARSFFACHYHPSRTIKALQTTKITKLVLLSLSPLVFNRRLKKSEFKSKFLFSAPGKRSRIVGFEL